MRKRQAHHFHRNQYPRPQFQLACSGVAFVHRVWGKPRVILHPPRTNIAFEKPKTLWMGKSPYLACIFPGFSTGTNEAFMKLKSLSEPSFAQTTLTCRVRNQWKFDLLQNMLIFSCLTCFGKNSLA